MPAMSWSEKTLCGSRAWGWFARRVVLPWALRGWDVDGEVLEIGSGSGAMASEVLATHPGARITATDFDPDMLERGLPLLSPYGDRASVRQADATALPFPDGRFDAVVSFLMLHHVGRWETALSEAVRVLRPGGRLVGYDLLDTRASRFLHGFSRTEGIRLVSAPELSKTLDALPLGGVSVAVTGRLLVRFSGTRV